MSTTAIILIIAAIFGVLCLLVGVPLGLGIWKGYHDAMARAAKGAASVDPKAVALDTTYATPNGLITAHYPSDFAANKLDDATITVSRNFGGGEDELLTFAGVHKPITRDPRELGRILLGLVEKSVAGKGGTSTKTPAKDTKCLGRYEGVEVEGTFTLPSVGTYRSWACFFVVGERGYEIRYDVPKSREGTEVALLERIVAATEIAAGDEHADGGAKK
jgi:hypothetical protein